MNEKDWRYRYQSLAQQKLPEEARQRIRSTLQTQPAEARPARGGLSRSGWWLAAGAVAAGLIALAVFAHRPPANQPAHHPTKKPAPTVPAARAPLQHVDMVSATAGWGVTQKGQVIRTSDGGSTWTVVTPTAMQKTASSNAGIGLAASDATHAWVAVGSLTSNTAAPVVVYRTSDGGRTWQKAPAGARGWSPQVDFLSAHIGYILLHEGAAAGSEGVILLGTTDGGATWTIIAKGDPSAPHPANIFGGDKSGLGFLDAQRGWITGNWAADSILLYQTTDGGKTWGTQTLPLPHGLTAQGGSAQSEPPTFFGTSDGVLPVEFFAPGEPVVFYRTTDGGTTWTPTAPVNGGGNHPVYCVVSQKVIIVTDGTKLQRSTDGGATWTSVQPNTSLQGVKQLDFTSASDGFAVAGGQLLQTTDGGATWTKAGASSGS